jgi:hypothetical protein
MKETPMRGVTQNFISSFRRRLNVDTGALARVALASLVLSACSAAVPDAEKALSAASKKPDGVYGISPTVLQLRASNKANYSGLNVYSSVAGVQTPLATNFNTGYISGLGANTSYALKVHGVTPGSGESVLPLKEYYTRTWPTFASSSWTLVEDTARSNSVDGSIFTLSWAYSPWNIVPAGDGALEGTLMRCYFVPGTQPDPFVGSAKTVDALVNEGHLDISSGALGLSDAVRVGCEVHYIDGTVSRHLTTRLGSFKPAVAACPAKEVTVYDVANPYSCAITEVAGSTIDQVSYSLQMDPSNTCAFISTSSSVADPTTTPAGTAAGLSGSPYATDSDLTPSQTCNLRYRLVGPSFTSEVLNTVVKIKNVQPVWTQFPATKTIREISPNDPGVPTVSGVVDRSSLLAAPSSPYVLKVGDLELETNKEEFARNRGTSFQFGKYFLDSTTTNSCSKFGQVGYLSGATVVAGVEPKSGGFVFVPYDYFFGSCTVDVYFDDGQAADHRSETRSLNVVVQGYNDPPNLAKPALAPGNIYSCGDGGHCYVGIDYDLSLKADVGGINPTLTSINESANQTLFLKNGNCISSNETYLKVSYCQLDANKNLILSFTPLALPPVGTPVYIKVRVSDDGLNSMPSARFPVTAGNSPTNSCLRGSSCGGPYPDTNRDSTDLVFQVDIAEFNLPLRPALIVSKAACLACHAKVNKGDFITDFGNSGTGSRFTNMFFKRDTTPSMVGDNGWLDNRGDHFSGFLSLDALEGSLYTKRAKMVRDTATKVNQSWVLDNMSWVDASSTPHPAGSMNEINLLDFLQGKGFRSDPYSTGNQGPFVAVQGKGHPDISIRDTLPNNDAIEFLRIDAPIATDIRSIAQQASPGSGGYAINWAEGGAYWPYAGAAVGALYRIPDAGSGEVRPFSGLQVSTKQPFETVINNAQPADVPSYVRNVGVINCYGDVVVKGNLFLSSPEFNTDSRGCRIHVTGDIIFHAYNGYSAGGSFVPGRGIKVNSPGNAFGVQITSASSVNFGVAQNQLASYLRQMPDSAKAFAAAIKVPYGSECYNASGVVRARTGELCDTGFTAMGSDTVSFPAGLDGWDHGTIDYTKLMINAPVINSRYLGTVTGSIIADYALFRLGTLTFYFDDAFLGQVPFPRLQTVQPNPRVIFNAGLCSKYPKECANGSN